MSLHPDVTITITLKAEQAAGLARFCEKVTHSDAVAVLYPHVDVDVRTEQAYAITRAFGVIERALADANVRTWPWLDTGRVR